MSDRLVRTFLDSGVLITGYNGKPDLKDRALPIMKDPGRIFLSSPYVRHEVPKARFNKRHLEYRFYQSKEVDLPILSHSGHLPVCVSNPR